MPYSSLNDRVNALCIVHKPESIDEQNTVTHTDDWAVEAEQMASVYQNVYITVATGTAVEYRDGS
jgi:hypothetical protein